ncbi:unnamed protein product [Blepharisma stoltei]|uniref:Uncharacterized protein n=1 Tax=Blepharisma stoltei TaxID=1481888 RepID=A0AAU9JPG3_9CILI|nr:unnamed protein product [Blepharisma stoltei]
MDLSESQSARKERVTSLKNVSGKIEFIVDDLLTNIESLRRRILEDSMAHSKTIHELTTNLHKLKIERTESSVKLLKLQDSMNKQLHEVTKELLRQISDYKMMAQSRASVLREIKALLVERTNKFLINPLSSRDFELDEVNKLTETHENDIKTKMNSIKTKKPFENLINHWNQKVSESDETMVRGEEMIKEINESFETAAAGYESSLEAEIEKITAQSLRQQEEFDYLIS